MSTKSFLLRLSKNSFSSFFLEKQERKAYIYILVISLFALLPLIQANALYVDDIKRVLTGFTEWGYDGRPLTTMLMRFLHIGEPLTDTSPASQVLAISIYSLCPIYASRQFDVKSRVFLILTGVIFTLNPFILQNYSYIFDSISMSLAALMATLAFTSISKELESPSIK